MLIDYLRPNWLVRFGELRTSRHPPPTETTENYAHSLRSSSTCRHGSKPPGGGAVFDHPVVNEHTLRGLPSPTRAEPDRRSEVMSAPVVGGRRRAAPASMRPVCQARLRLRRPPAPLWFQHSPPYRCEAPASRDFLCGSAKTHLMPDTWNTFEPIERIATMIEANLSDFRGAPGIM